MKNNFTSAKTWQYVLYYNNVDNYHNWSKLTNLTWGSAKPIYLRQQCLDDSMMMNNDEFVIKQCIFAYYKPVAREPDMGATLVQWGAWVDLRQQIQLYWRDTFALATGMPSCRCSIIISQWTGGSFSRFHASSSSSSSAMASYFSNGSSHADD